MIDVKEAVKNAITYIKNLYDTHEINYLRLEEVELSDDQQYWLITLSFTQPQSQTSPLQALIKDPTSERVYKVIKIRANTGQALSMKIREI